MYYCVHRPSKQRESIRRLYSINILGVSCVGNHHATETTAQTSSEIITKACGKQAGTQTPEKRSSSRFSPTATSSAQGHSGIRKRVLLLVREGSAARDEGYMRTLLDVLLCQTPRRAFICAGWAHQNNHARRSRINWVGRKRRRIMYALLG